MHGILDLYCIYSCIVFFCIFYFILLMHTRRVKSFLKWIWRQFVSAVLLIKKFSFFCVDLNSICRYDFHIALCWLLTSLNVKVGCVDRNCRVTAMKKQLFVLLFSFQGTQYVSKNKFVTNEIFPKHLFKRLYVVASWVSSKNIQLKIKSG